MRRISILAIALAGLAVLFAGCSSNPKKKDYPVTVARFMVETTGDEVGVPVRLPVSGSVVRISPRAMITEYDITYAELLESDLGPCVMFQLSQQAGRDLYRISATNQGNRLVTTVNGRPLAAYRMDRPMGEGMIISYLEVPAAEMAEMVKNINKTSADLQKELEKKKK